MCGYISYQIVLGSHHIQTKYIYNNAYKRAHVFIITDYRVIPSSLLQLSTRFIISIRYIGTL